MPGVGRISHSRQKEKSMKRLGDARDVVAEEKPQSVQYHQNVCVCVCVCVSLRSAQPRGLGYEGKELNT